MSSSESTVYAHFVVGRHLCIVCLSSRVLFYLGAGTLCIRMHTNSLPMSSCKKVIAAQIKTITNLHSCPEIGLRTSWGPKNSWTGQVMATEGWDNSPAGVWDCLFPGDAGEQSPPQENYLVILFMLWKLNCTIFFCRKKETKLNQNLPQNSFTLHLRTKRIRPTQTSVSSKVRKKIFFNVLTESVRASSL